MTMNGRHCWLAILLTVVLVGCVFAQSESPERPVAPDVAPTSLPSPAVPETALPLIIITPASGVDPGDGAFFHLNVTVKDEQGLPLAALVTISWPDSAAVFAFGPASQIEIPMRLMAAAPRFLVTVEKDGYSPVEQPFEVTLREDLVYEWNVTLRWIGVTARHCCAFGYAG